MRRKGALGSLVGRGEGTKGAETEVARDIDWVKVRRVQHRLWRPHEGHAGSSYGFVSYEEIEAAEARSRRALRLAHALAFVAGVLLGFAFLGGFAVDPVLLGASVCLALAGLVSACRALS